MMQSLVTKLTLAFLAVGLVGAVLVAFLVRASTRTAFDQFVLDREQEILVSSLEQFYQENGDWAGVEEYMRRPPADDDRARGGRGDLSRNLGLFTLFDAQGNVVFSSRPFEDRTALDRNSDRVVAIDVNSETVGYLYRDQVTDEWLRSSPEGIFLERVNGAARLSALVAAVLALVMGSLLAFTLTRSLTELREASDDIASGNLGRQVKIRSKDEVGQLATSFNRMSRDLAQATQARRQMTADIAHDLRTPLSVIAGYTEALSDGKLPGTPDVYTVLHKETQYLKRLIDDLRVLSLADAGELQLTLQAIRPQACLEQAAVRHAVAAQDKGIKLQVLVAEDLPEIEADQERLAQVIDNLVGNALRHTPSGGQVTLSAALQDDQVKLQVADTGSGIPAEDLPNIFNRFFRGDSARQSSGESGLGLAIAKSIVVAHHGSISVISQPGDGAVFSILLPAYTGEKTSL